MPLIVISALLHSYVGWRIVPALPGPWPAAAFATLLAASAVLMPFGLWARRIRSQPLSDRLAWIGLLLMGLFSSLFVLTLLRDAALLLAFAILAARPSAFSFDLLAAWTAASVPLVGIGVTLLGLVNARRTAAVVSVDVPIVDLPEALHGFTIAQISDVHVGPTIKRDYLDSIVGAVNRIGADMVAVTGDLVDGPVERLAGHVAPLARLVSRHGTFFVTGNHEYYSGAPAWIAELRRLGLQVLLNEHVVLRHGAASVVVAGVTDFGAHHYGERYRSDPQAALAGAPADAPVRVLLAHQPRSAMAAADAGFDLQLSGHTHGGQFLPWNFLVRLQQPFTAGLHRWRALWVYTSRGTGYWGPPKRFGAPSEITRLRLVPAGAG
ncbi:MAG: metallophosphoesterase [Caldimonas sp.]